MFDAIPEKLTSAAFWQAVGPGLAVCLVILIVVIAKRTTGRRSNMPRRVGRTAQTEKSGVQQTTYENPFRIENPTIGFLNLMGDKAAGLLAVDQNVLSPLFQNCEVSTGAVPKCQVLFVYDVVEPTGRIAGCQTSLRDLIKEAGAYVAVVATENGIDSYVKAMETRNDWYANIVLTADRRGEKFAPFFHDLFSLMFQGKSMLMAWVELAPQIPNLEHPDGPNLVMAAEAGHIVFRQSH